MEMKESLPVVFFDSSQAWENWLEQHHTEPKGVWLKIAKKEAGLDTVSYSEALDTALCYGWIDGQKGAYDDRFWLQKFSPRSPKSRWSKVNCQKALALIAAGRMQPAGLRQVELAKSDGRWDAAYESQSKIGVPDDFQSALDQHPQAKEFFHTLNSANRYAILYRIQTAIKPETRTARIQKLVAMLERNEKIHP